MSMLRKKNTMEQNTENAGKTRSEEDLEVMYALSIDRVVGRQAVVGYATVVWRHRQAHWCVGIAHRRCREDALLVRESMGGRHRRRVLIIAHRWCRSVEHGEWVDEGWGVVRES